MHLKKEHMHFMIIYNIYVRGRNYLVYHKLYLVWLHQTVQEITKYIRIYV